MIADDKRHSLISRASTEAGSPWSPPADPSQTHTSRTEKQTKYTVPDFLHFFTLQNPMVENKGQENENNIFKVSFTYIRKKIIQ